MKRTSLVSIVLSLLCLTPLMSASAQDYYFYTNSGGTITVARYIGPPGDMTVPDTLNDLPVTEIGSQAFYSQSGIAGVTIPDSVTLISGSAFASCVNMDYVLFGQGVTEIGDSAFSGCTSLSDVTIPYSVTTLRNQAFHGCTWLTNIVIGQSITSMGDATFGGCLRLTSVAIPDSVTSIGTVAFFQCLSLTNVILGSGITNLGNSAFSSCNLKTIYGRGNAPSLGSSVFSSGEHPTVYYLPEATNWDAFATSTGFTTVLWNPEIQNISTTFGGSSNLFGFNITGTANLVVVVEANADLASSTWAPVGTNTLTGGSSDFSDPNTGSYDQRFYRIHNPFTIPAQYVPQVEEQEQSQQMMQRGLMQAWSADEVESDPIMAPLPPPPPMFYESDSGQ